MAWISPRTGKTLSAPQQRRYERAGITQAQYQSGVPLGAARGHRNEREERQRRREGNYNTPWIKRAKDNGLYEILPALPTYSKEQQEDISRAYLGAFFYNNFKRYSEIKSQKQSEWFRDYAQLRDFMSEPNSEATGIQVYNKDESYREARGDYNQHIGYRLHGPSWSPA